MPTPNAGAESPKGPLGVARGPWAPQEPLGPQGPLGTIGFLGPLGALGPEALRAGGLERHGPTLAGDSMLSRGLAVCGEAGSRLNPPAHLRWSDERVECPIGFSKTKLPFFYVPPPPLGPRIPPGRVLLSRLLRLKP